MTINTYNGINNILSTTAGESTISYEYMQWGSLVKSITNATGTVTYGYNNKGIVTSEASTADNTSKSYTYDKNGNQTNLTISQNGSQLINQTNTFNSVGQLTQVYDAKNSKTLASYTYDNAGNVTSKETANGMQKTTYSYNESNLLTKVQNMSIGNQQTGQFGTYSSYAYEYYLDGSKEKETDNIGKTKSYTYDGAGRLLTERYDNQSGLDSWANMYTYDARGNRNYIRYSKGNKAYIDSFIEGISSSAYDEETVFESIPDRIKNAKSTSTSYSYDNNNRLIQQTWYSDDMWVHDKRTYTYDKNGNLTAKNTNIYYYDFAPEDAMTVEYMDKDESYSYNSFNILIGYSASGYNVETVNASYTYDPKGQRISKTVNGVTTNHIWDNSGNIVVENDKIYNRGLSGEIISARGGGGSQDWAGDLSYSYNGHGDTTNLTQQSSGVALAMTATYEYDAFGNCLTTGGEADNNPFRYNGQYTDDETGLIYLRNRYYDPSIGRFTQEDPAKDGSNWYVYCGNDPVNMVDPWGTYYVFSTQEQYDTFESYARSICGDGLNITNDENNPLIIKGFDISMDEAASEVGAALLGYWANNDIACVVSFTDDPDIDNAGTGSINGNPAGVIVSTLNDGSVANDRIDELVMSVLIHELMHSYTETMKYNDYVSDCIKVNPNNINGYSDAKYELVRGYGEASAIMIENIFRKQMGFSERNVEKSGGITTSDADENSHGFWPWLAINDKRSTLLYQSCIMDIVPVNMSFGLYFDILRNYESSLK